ncbi:MAG: S9 family peptidase, partial [Bdellovibrionales bacterium]|nr:S9 family peptidase [Bdellovibrionales bacterium]
MKCIFFFFVGILIFMTGCQTSVLKDNHLWLEDIEGDASISWAKKQNEQTLSYVSKDDRYEPLKKQMTKILTSKDRIPNPSYFGGYVYNFWQDKKSVRGVWRRATLASFKRKFPRWETVLDIDKLAEIEKENWVYKGARCLPPQFERCLMTLSRGGTDASVMREFDIKKKKFVKGGFELPQGKSDYSWLDKNHILVGTNFGEGTVSDSGYPIVVKVWRRGTPLSQAKEVFHGNTKDVGIWTSVKIGKHYVHPVITQSKTFFTGSNYYLKDLEKLILIPVPESAEMVGILEDQFIFQLRKEWSVNGANHLPGEIISFSVSEFLKNE